MDKRLLVLALLATCAGNAEPRDPTQPGNLPANQPAASGDSALTLSAIRISETARHAIINGIILKAGQSLDDDTRLLSIHADHVVVGQHGIHKKLYLVPSIKDR